MSLVIFEGVDGSGKGTLLRAFREATRYAHLEWDRGYLSRLVYAQYYGRPTYTDPKLLKESISEFKKFLKTSRPLVVYLYAREDVLNKRIRARGEDPSQSPNPVVVSGIFNKWLEYFDLEERLATFDTSGDPDLGKMVDVITKRLKQLQRKGRR